MKKILALILALAMAAALVACGGTGNNSTPSSGSNTPSGSASSEPAGSGDAAPTIDPLTFNINTTFYETDTAGEVTNYFVEQLAELSGGAITATVSWGGTLYDDTSAYDAVKSGAIEMIVMKETRILNFLPLIGIPSCAPASDGQGALDYMNAIFFEDERSSAAIQALCEEQGIKMLGVMTTGENCFAADFAWATLDELVAGCGAFGAKATAKYEAIGLNCAAYGGPEVYDAISRGIIDAANYTVYGAYSMSWAEVAPYIVRDTLWAVGNTMTVNASWFNGLSAAQQEVIQAAATAASKYSAEFVTGAMDDICAEMTAASGVDILTLSAEDSAEWWTATFNATAADSMKRVAGTDYEADMIYILEKAAEITGIEWSYEG